MVSVLINKGIVFKRNDRIEVQFGSKCFKAKIIGCGGGGISQGEDCYLMIAPYKGISFENLHDDEKEVDSDYMLIKAKLAKLPFDKLPKKVKIKKINAKTEVQMTITAIVGSKENCKQYMFFLDEK